MGLQMVILDICRNNAGVFMKDFVASDDGIELMFATHVVGIHNSTCLCCNARMSAWEWSLSLPRW